MNQSTGPALAIQKGSLSRRKSAHYSLRDGIWEEGGFYSVSFRVNNEIEMSVSISALNSVGELCLPELS